MTRRARSVGAGAVIATGLLGLIAPAASAQSIERGELVVVSASGDALEGGGSATPFSLRLPDSAACEGDSAEDGYRVNSYMVPAEVDPADVTYDGLGPTPTKYGSYDGFRMPLYKDTSDFFVSIQTADAEERGDPGPIVDLPLFDFDVYGPGDVPPGRYHLGIACTLLNEITRLWDAEIIVAADAADEPAQLSWQVVGFQPSETSGVPVLPIAAGVIAAGAIVAVLIRRRASAATLPGRHT